MCLIVKCSPETYYVCTLISRRDVALQLNVPFFVKHLPGDSENYGIPGEYTQHFVEARTLNSVDCRLYTDLELVILKMSALN